MKKGGKRDLYPEWLQYGDKGNNKILPLHVLFSKTAFPRKLIIPLRRICTGACTPPQIPKSRQGGTSDSEAYYSIFQICNLHVITYPEKCQQD